MAKTNHPRPAGRIVHIHRRSDGKLLAVKRSSSLKQALVEYYKETLKPAGYFDPGYVGNVVTVYDKYSNIVQYVATEAK